MSSKSRKQGIFYLGARRIKEKARMIDQVKVFTLYVQGPKFNHWYYMVPKNFQEYIWRTPSIKDPSSNIISGFNIWPLSLVDQVSPKMAARVFNNSLGVPTLKKRVWHCYTMSASKHSLCSSII